MTTPDLLAPLRGKTPLKHSHIWIWTKHDEHVCTVAPAQKAGLAEAFCSAVDLALEADARLAEQDREIAALKARAQLDQEQHDKLQAAFADQLTHIETLRARVEKAEAEVESAVRWGYDNGYEQVLDCTAPQESDAAWTAYQQEQQRQDETAPKEES